MARPLVVALTLVVLLSGCSGSPDSAPASPTEAATQGPANGALAVHVVDDEEVPVADAAIAIEGPAEQEAKTPANGRHTFANLPPGSYRVAVAKLGFESTVRAADVAPGATATVDVRLKPLPISTEPIVLMSEHKGFLQCGANVYYPTNYCGETLGQDKAKFPFEVLENLTFEEAIFELVWTPATAATGQELELDVCERQTSPNALNCVADGDYYKWTSGPPPRVLRLSDLPIDETRLYEVDVGSGYLSPYPTWQQSFTLYVSLCYVFPCADDYTAVPGA